MKKVKVITTLALILTAFFTLARKEALAEGFIQELIIMSPGDEIERNFYIRDVFDIQRLGPAKNFIILTAGTAETLSIELSLDLEELELGFDDRVSFSLIGTGFSPEQGASFIFETGETPFSITKEIPVNADFGFAAVSTLITGYRGDVDMPIPCTLAFSLYSPGQEDAHEEEEDDDHEEEEDDDHAHE
jgi:hypothetical protein